MEESPLIPARILNEFVYCPRLAYLEWVQSEWADNAFTAEGSWVHRRVDRREGWLPNPEEAELLPFRSRSVELSAPGEGLVGKLDVVDVDGYEAVPVEYKRGRPPKTGESAYPSDLAQLGAQALLLRENGWTVRRGYFFYAESREKLEVAVDDELVAATRKAITALREAFAQPLPPPPLVASPKCFGCSLNSICLPDETYMLSGAPKCEVRQLLAPSDDALPLYLQTNGLIAGISGDVLEIREKGKVVATARLIDTSQVCLFGNIQVSTQAIRELAQRNIPICYFSYGGWFCAMTTGMAHRNVELRRAQYRAAFDPTATLKLSQRLVSAKIRNARTFLRRNARPQIDPRILGELKRLALSAERATGLDALLGLEGMAARIYFKAFPMALKNSPFLAEGGFDSATRNRRPPRDPLNALFSYVYSLLVKELTVIAAAVGFDPYQGFYHQPRYGKPSLALDLMEEFRVLVADSTVLSIVNNRVVGVDDFQRAGGGVSMLTAARRRVTEAYERRLQELITHPWFGYRLSYRRVLYVQTRLLARHLMGEIEEFPPFLTR